MANKKKHLKILIIAVPGSNRIDPLLEALSGSTMFDVITFEAIMYSRAQKEFKPNFTKQKSLYGRELSNGEIGCAISHQIVQAKYKSHREPIIVLEDDARIKNLARFQNVIKEFTEQYSETTAVLSLLPWGTSDIEKVDATSKYQIIPLVGKSALTVGYVITQKAMVALSEINKDFAYLPDWPPAKVKHFVTKQGLINHGDKHTISLIDQSGRVKTENIKVLLRFTCIPYLRNHRVFKNFREYFNHAIKPSLTWRIDRFRLR